MRFFLNYLSARRMLRDSKASSGFLKFSFGEGFSEAISSTTLTGSGTTIPFSFYSYSFATSSNGSPRSSSLAFLALAFSSSIFLYFSYSALILSCFFFSSAAFFLAISSSAAYFLASSSYSVSDIFSRSGPFSFFSSGS